MPISQPGKASGFIPKGTQWLLVALFVFPILPFKYVNLLFMLFALFVVISLFMLKPKTVWQSMKNNILIAIPFIPYLFDLLFHPHSSVVAFEFQKKLLFFTGPLFIGMYVSMYPIKPLKIFMYVFTSTIIVITLYTLACLLYRNILFLSESYNNGAYILRTNFENISHLHPTYYSLFATIGILWIMFDYKNQKGWMKAFYVVGGLILLFQELFVAAKMPIIALVISGLFMIYKITLNRKRLLTIYAILIPCMVILPLVIPSLKSRVYEIRSSVESNQDHFNTISDREVIFECSKTVFLNNIWLGVGSGNYQNMLDQCYKDKGLVKAKTIEFNAHNQFLTLGINYGIVPLLIFILAIGIYFKRTVSNPFATCLMISSILVMCSESILERQWGVYFFVLFFLVITNIHRAERSEAIKS